MVVHGVRFLESRQDHWSDNPRLNCHVWWHMALHHVQRGERDRAIQVRERHMISDKNSISCFRK